MIVTSTMNGQFTSELAFLTRVRLRAQRQVLWMQALWASDGLEIDRDLIIPHSEVNRILSDPQEMLAAEANFYQHDREAQQLSQQIQIVDGWSNQDSAWKQLRQVFGLSEAESDLLALAIAIEVDPQLQRVYAYLHDNATMGYATPWLAANLFQWRDRIYLGAQSALVRWQLAQPIGPQAQPCSIKTAWVADAAIVAWLTQGQRLDTTLGTAVQWISATSQSRDSCFYPEQLVAIHKFVDAIQGNQDSQSKPNSVAIAIELVAPNGTGKCTLATQVCAWLGLDLLLVNTNMLLGAEVSLTVAGDRLMRVIRLAKLHGAVPYWRDCQAVSPNVWQSIQESCALMFFGVTVPLRQSVRGTIHRAFHLPVLTRNQRIHLWQQLTNGDPIPDAVVNWVLTPSEITAAARVTAAGSEVVTEVCRQMLYQGSNELLASLICPYTWEDIVLPPSTRQHLAELEQQARLRSTVYEDWGFERLCPLGRGITALFAGSSGTGKTMAVQVMARSLGMELYRVDLAGVVNKYIGETEKRLKLVFDACERANVMLFFDEADALFGQRSQVKDAHDRYANIQIDYLLQRMEEFDGIAILATNRKGDLDQAFLRRIRFIVDFVQPGVPERLALWQLALLERTPSGEELLDQINWQFLAERLHMTGANIKAAALAAAFLAHAQGTRITMSHVLHSAQREMTKHGVALRLEDWKGFGGDDRSSVLN